jgi:hypothetical protein
MTLFDLIMGGKFSKADWSLLGKGQIADEEKITKMLMEGYEALADED